MQARRLVIEEKCRKVVPELVSPTDFKVRDGGAVDPQILLQNPHLSLYCLDFEHRQALFVETSPECRLSQAPFLYQAQYEAANHLIQVPYDILHSLAAEVSLDPSKLILIYSVGWCGSTTVRLYVGKPGIPPGRRRRQPFRAGCLYSDALGLPLGGA